MLLVYIFRYLQWDEDYSLLII